ncbi:amidohydrolase [bacterium]|nr:amidohydrolase [bacterium]
MDTTRDELAALLETLTVVDCHSHTHLKCEYTAEGPWDLFRMTAYFDREIAGLLPTVPGPIRDPHASDDLRWEHLRAILARARNESYWRHNLVVYRDLFGMEGEELSDANWQALNERIKTQTAAPDWFHHVLVERARVRTQVKNIPWFQDWEPEYFTAILRMEPALDLYRSAPRRHLEEHLDREIRSLRELREALADAVAGYQQRGAVGIKLAHAYRRTLQSEPVPEVVAALIFERALRGETLPWSEAKRLEDYVIFFLAGLCTDTGLVFDIHTGVQGNGCWIPDSDPLLLLNLIRAFPGTRFNLYHGGYPWSREIGMMAKHFPNVWLNMAWMYVISMEASRQSLDEWIDLVPGHRLLGFGSDVNLPEFVYGHLVMARSCIADVLARKGKRDFLSRETAEDLGRMLLHDNAVELYGLTSQ